MDILDYDNTIDDPFKPKKPDEGFDFSPGKILKGLTDSFAATAGGDGGALPVDAYNAPRVQPITDNSGTVKPLATPIKPISVEPVKPLAQPTVAAVKIEPIKPLAELKAESQSRIDRGIEALNRLARPALQESENIAALGIRIAREGSFNPEAMADQLNLSAEANRQQSDQRGNLGIRIDKEIHINPEEAANQINKLAQTEKVSSEDIGTLGLRAKQEAKIDPEAMAGHINKLAQSDREDSSNNGTLGLRIQKEGSFNPETLAGQLNRTAEADRAESENTGKLGQQVQKEAEIIDPSIMLAKIRSAKWRQEMADNLSAIMNNTSNATYQAASDQIHGMAGWNNVRFDPSTINQ